MPNIAQNQLSDCSELQQWIFLVCFSGSYSALARFNLSQRHVKERPPQNIKVVEIELSELLFQFMRLLNTLDSSSREKF